MTPREALLAQAAQRILITDGAFGTEIQRWKLSEADYAGTLGLTKDQKGNNDILALTKPEVPESIHRAYFEAGADIAETNTFSANRISQADYAAEHLVHRIERRIGAVWRAASPMNTPPKTVARASLQARSARPTRPCRSRPDVNDPGFREIDLGPPGRGLPGTGRSPGRRRRRFHPDRDRVRHAQRQGRDHGGQAARSRDSVAKCRSCCR